MLVDSRDRHQHISYVGRYFSRRTRPPPLPPRHIPSPTHYTELGTRVSAGFFSPPAGVAGAGSGRHSGGVCHSDAPAADGFFDVGLGMCLDMAATQPAGRSIIL